MADRRNEIEQEATGWVLRLRGADAGAWEAFTIWLEADPAHAAAYEEAALVDLDLDGLAPPERMAPEWAPPAAPVRASWTSKAMVGWGAAAAAAAVLIGYTILPASSDRYAVETRAGERRSVQLEGGGRIDLNGGTRIELDRDNVRFARLEQGEALFTIAHDAAHPFEVEAGGATLRDMGTVFNVVADARRLEIGVAEGAVLFDPAGAKVNLTPGMTLRREGDGAPRVARTETDAVGAWRSGRLIYRSATVGEIADDLSRNLGVPVTASPAVAGQRFAGVIILDPNAETALRRSASVLGVRAGRSGNGWTLTTGSRDTP
jgi:transmembrane sensor